MNLQGNSTTRSLLVNEESREDDSQLSDNEENRFQFIHFVMSLLVLSVIQFLWLNELIRIWQSRRRRSTCWTLLLGIRWVAIVILYVAVVQSFVLFMAGHTQIPALNGCLPFLLHEVNAAFLAYFLVYTQYTGAETILERFMNGQVIIPRPTDCYSRVVTVAVIITALPVFAFFVLLVDTKNLTGGERHGLYTDIDLYIINCFMFIWIWSSPVLLVWTNAMLYRDRLRSFKQAAKDRRIHPLQTFDQCESWWRARLAARMQLHTLSGIENPNFCMTVTLLSLVMYTLVLLIRVISQHDALKVSSGDYIAALTSLLLVAAFGQMVTTALSEDGVRKKEIQFLADCELDLRDQAVCGRLRAMRDYIANIEPPTTLLGVPITVTLRNTVVVSAATPALSLAGKRLWDMLNR